MFQLAFLCSIGLSTTKLNNNYFNNNMFNQKMNCLCNQVFTKMHCVQKYDVSKQLERIRSIKKEYPDNIMAAVFDEKYFNTLTRDQQQRLLNCVNSGIENPDSSTGCYACNPNDYEEFKPFFKAVLEK